MTIYIQSRGKSQEHDHCWLEVRKDDQHPAMPPELKEIKPEELIDSQKPSIILARSGKFLILLVMALETGGDRIDFMGRQIRNSAAWIEIDSPDKEKLLRKITIKALKGELADAIGEAVRSDADSKNGRGFEANFEKLKAIGRSPDTEETVDSQAEPYLPKVGRDDEYSRYTKSLKSDLIEELRNYQLPKLPGDVQIFVVVTTLKSSAGLKAKAVWRGLSSRIETGDWESYNVSESEELGRKDSKKKLVIGGLTLFLLGLIAVVILMLASHPSSQNALPESISPAPVQPSEAETTPQKLMESRPQSP